MYTTYHISYNTLIYSQIESSIHFNPPKSPQNPSTKKTIKKHPPKPPPLFSGDEKNIPHPPPPPDRLWKLDLLGFLLQPCYWAPWRCSEPGRKDRLSFLLQRLANTSSKKPTHFVGSYRGEQQQQKMLGQKKKNGGGMNLFLNNWKVWTVWNDFS